MVHRMSEPIPVYVFRGLSGLASDPTIVSVAPLDLVLSVFGGGGLRGEGGLSDAFGGTAFFRNDETGQCYLGVWGARKASRFRRALRSGGATLNIVRERPPTRLISWGSSKGSKRRRSASSQERLQAMFR